MGYHYHLQEYHGQFLPEGFSDRGVRGLSRGEGKYGDATPGEIDSDVWGAEAILGRSERSGGAGPVQLAGLGSQAGAS